jgi:hypothetical protein
VGEILIAVAILLGALLVLASSVITVARAYRERDDALAREAVLRRLFERAASVLEAGLDGSDNSVNKHKRRTAKELLILARKIFGNQMN